MSRVPRQREGREVPTDEAEPQQRTRREVLRTAGLFAATAAGVGGGLQALTRRAGDGPALISLPGVNGGGPGGSGAQAAAGASPVPPPRRLAIARTTRSYDTTEPVTSYPAMTSFNNFYEFGFDKQEPADNAGRLRTRPWTVQIDGEVRKNQTIDIDALETMFPLEQRVYRMRCVEGWSMVMPWVGFPLASLLRHIEPTGAAKYVQFTTLNDPVQMPGVTDDVLEWPYTEGLRLDEAMHPLTLMALGLDGRALPPQNGAPLRLVVPWKYGFKGAKSIVRITLTRDQPQTTWALAAPGEYGFYANVNPEVDHPRWSQATERRIGDVARRETLPFNGYADEVAHLYRGMNLREHF